MKRLNNVIKYGFRYGNLAPRQELSGFLEWGMLREVLSDFRINCVLDVGANIGQFAKNLRRIGYRDYICSFEPTTEAFSSLTAILSKDPKWFGYNYALGSKNTTQTFHVATESTAMSSFLSPQDKSWKLREEAVEVKRLDEVFWDVLKSTKLEAPRVFLKMDTQGYDLEVFQGAEQCISQIIGLQSEISVRPVYQEMPHYLDSLLAYEQQGFELYNLADVFRHPHDKNIIEMNCVMMRISEKGVR